MRKIVATVTGCLLIAGSVLLAQTHAQKPPKSETPPAAGHEAMPHAAKPSSMSDAAKIKLAMSAGPADVSRHAAIMEPGPDGKMKELRAGTNGWMCMPAPEVMCLDQEWQGWANAWMSKTDPSVKGVGIGYMLQGDKGASNTDPFATAATADNHWVVSPAHVMVLTPDTAMLNALPTDPHTGGPFVMWKGTKYAHIMVPTAAMPKPAGAGGAK